MMAEDGSGSVNLSKHANFESAPSIDPSGSWILFTSQRDGNREIYLMNNDGSAQKRLTMNEVHDDNASWSPDGIEFVFESNNDIYLGDVGASTSRDFHGDLGWSSSDSFQRKRLTNSIGVSKDQSPSWSPDGRYIVFTSDRNGISNIYVMNPDGSNQTNISNSADKHIQPEWSPRGDKIAYTVKSGFTYEIYVMNVDGSNQTRILQSGSEPSWSPNGDKIAYTVSSKGNKSIWVANSDGSQQVRILTIGSEPDWGN